jgi:tRNA(Arg) A34 adenosine deaminase TadA
MGAKNGNNANNVTMHSEQNVIDKYIKLYRRKGYKDSDIRRKLGKQCIIVVRISNDNIITNSAPCANCIKCLKNNNIKKIIYSLNDGTLQFSRVKDLDDTHISRGQRAILRKNNIND